MPVASLPVPPTLSVGGETGSLAAPHAPVISPTTAGETLDDVHSLVSSNTMVSWGP